MTTSEQPQPVENNNNFAPSTIESRARAFREFRSREVLFNGLLTEDPVERASASTRIVDLLKKYAREYYQSETAGTVPSTGDKEIKSGVSSPLNNSNVLVTPLSSLSPFNSPLFTDGSSSASASSYAPSPNIHKYTNEEGVNTNVGENLGEYINMEFQRNGIPDGPNNNISRRNSTDVNSANSASSASSANDAEKSGKEVVRLLALTVLRMSIDCPFPDVRHSFNKCLKRLREMNVPVPSPINSSPSFYIAPEEIITLEWPSESTNNLTQSTPRSITPSGCSSSCSSSSSNSTSFSEEIPRVIQHPLTPATPFSPPSLSVGRLPDEMVKEMMINTFTRLGRLSHFYRILAYFPSFMEKYQTCFDTIIRNPNLSSVPLSWRFYIGIMAASQYKSQYVVSKLTNDFLLEGGNIDWLQGLQHVPAKILNLATINTILAHQPWRLRPSHIHTLIKGSQDPRENWTSSEIVHVILILSTFHSLSSFVLGCGIVPEYDTVGGSCEQLLPTTPIEGNSIGITNNEISPEMGTGLGVSLVEPRESETTTESVRASEPIPIPNSTNSRNSLTSERVDIEMKHTSQLLRRLNLQNKDEDMQNNHGSLSNEDSYSLLRMQFDNVDNVDEETFTDITDDIDSPFMFSQEFFSNTPRTSSLAQPTYSPPPTEDFSRFLDPNVKISHADFPVNSSEYNVFKLQDYCWETQGVTMVNNYFAGVGEALDREFSEIRDLTDYSLFHSYKSSFDLDTTPLRQAIWYYVQRLSGLFRDDYEYRQINKFLNKKIKAFLKKVCCTPEDIRYSDWNVVGFRLREEEKCHVNLIAVEARKQAELIYGLSCVMRYQKGEE